MFCRGRYLRKVEPLKLCLAGGDSNFNMMPKTFEWMQKLRAFDEMQKLKSRLLMQNSKCIKIYKRRSKNLKKYKNQKRYKEKDTEKYKIQKNRQNFEAAQFFMLQEMNIGFHSKIKTLLSGCKNQKHLRRQQILKLSKQSRE